ncbi:MAG TPA: hypothetical protein GXX39_04295 [Syntrophothermus lipocalidus]|nr:hypothetical protein [Syntrophothermus lipocalidus]HOV43713.1 hypothetical protein [Syntrophothermus lipocalidus]
MEMLREFLGSLQVGSAQVFDRLGIYRLCSVNTTGSLLQVLRQDSNDCALSDDRKISSYHAWGMQDAAEPAWKIMDQKV